MRCAPLWALLTLLCFVTNASAQFGGGGLGGGEMMGGNFGFASGMPAEEARPDQGIEAYRTAPAEGGKLQVVWTGTSAQASQKIATRLENEETKIQFINTPLPEVVGYLESLHEVPIALDEAELKRNKIALDLAITVNLESVTVPVALDRLTQQHDLGWYIEGGVLVITSYDVADYRQSVRIYKLHRLDAVGAAKVVTQSIFPDSWSEQGGDAGMTVVRDRNLLVIRQNREGHAAVESLLTQLEEMKSP